MYVGHEFLALAAGIALARMAGAEDARALSVGLLAGASAALPDLDVLVALVSVGGLSPGQGFGAWDQFWAASDGIHRGVTHTLAAGASAGVVLAASAVGQRAALAGRRLSLLGAVGSGLAAVLAVLLLFGPAVPVTGWLGFGLLAAGAIVLGGYAGSRTVLGGPAILGAALLGLLSHPFGDVFMASPPRAFFPLGIQIPAEAVRLAADPTWNLVGITLVELATVWIGLVAVTGVTAVRLPELIDRRAALGLLFPLVMLALPRPTMADAHWLGFPLAPFALVGIAAFRDADHEIGVRVLRGVGTGAATLTIAILAYGLLFAITSA